MQASPLFAMLVAQALGSWFRHSTLASYRCIIYVDFTWPNSQILYDLLALHLRAICNDLTCNLKNYVTSEDHILF